MTYIAQRLLKTTAALAVAGTLAACGGGGSGSDTSASAASATPQVTASDVTSSPDALTVGDPAAHVTAATTVPAEGTGSTSSLVAVTSTAPLAFAPTALATAPLAYAPTTNALPVQGVGIVVPLSPPTQLTLRAHGTLAGDIGPKVEIRVAGVTVQTIEVRATQPTDYVIPVPALAAGTKIDVVYTNDGSSGGVDRNLFVSYLIAANTYLLPTAPGVTYDRGVGTAAFDGQDVIPGQVAMSWGGSLRATWPSPNLTQTLTLRASGRLAGGVGPRAGIRVNGVIVGATEIRATEPTDYVFTVPALAVAQGIDVVYDNDAVVNGEDRGLYVHYLLSGTTYLMPNATGVTYDQGSGTAAWDGANVVSGQSFLSVNGALRGKWPAPNLTDKLTVRASGTLAGGVGPHMQVHVDGIVVGTTEVKASSTADYTFDVPPLRPGSKIDVAYINDAVIQGVDRNLTVSNLIAAKTYAVPTMSGVIFDAGSGAAAFDGVGTAAGQASLASNGALRFAWPSPNLTDFLTARAKSTLASNVGAMMQLRVDGVVVGSADVKATDWTDYVFAVPQMQPGRSVDVVFTNDAVIDGQDRNLYVQYLASVDTTQLSTAAGVVYDRGAGAGAFDGVNTSAGTTALTSNGALRMQWPQPNLTSSVVVRASGTLAENVGPLMQLRVNGVTVSTTEVRATSPTDYVMRSVPLSPGDKVDVVYVNDAVVGGVDRNLSVAYLLQSATHLESSSSKVQYDRGTGMAAFDGVDVVPGQATMSTNGALRSTWPNPTINSTIVVSASGNLAANVGPRMELRVNGVVMGSVEVRSTSWTDYTFNIPTLAPGAKIDVVYTNDEAINGQDRNLYVRYVRTALGTFLPSGSNVRLDSGSGDAAFDGITTAAGSSGIYTNGALRFTLPSTTVAAPSAQQQDAARFLQQATFGASAAEVQRVVGMGKTAWIDEQIQLASQGSYVSYIQGKYDLGDAYRPKGSQFSINWAGQRFWARAATSQDQLRKRVAFALHQIVTVSQTDASLSTHLRAFANYLDLLDRNALGNYRTLMEDVALSPAMGIYLSHIRNRREDPTTGRLPDENFAREIMQLFSIGLHELNGDGTPKLNTNGQPIETYSNADVMALAKVFTGYSWAFPDNELTEQNFRYSNPDYSQANDKRIDLLPMKNYPGQHSTAEKRLFAGKTNEVVIPANSTAAQSLRAALDGLFRHPNVGPFVSRQLIQRLVDSNPSPAYVARVASKFNNDGTGVRGNMAAVVRAVLTDAEALTPPSDSIGKLREPILRVAQWMRAFGAVSASGEYLMAGELDNMSERALFAPSVFGYYRPGYVPPNTALAALGKTAPELQITNESTTANWVNIAFGLAGSGIGWTGTARDVSTPYSSLVVAQADGNIDALIGQINLLLFSGRMSDTLRQTLLEGVSGIAGSGSEVERNRARLAVFLALSSTEYLVQR
jgi:uncharacterized protein (DUF1800 family)